MVTVHAGGANSTIVGYLDNQTFQGSFLPKNTNGSSSCLMSQPTVSTTDGLHKCYRSKHVHARFKGFPLSFDTLTNKCLCQSLDRVSSDDEYHSSTKIAISLFRRYRNVLDRGGTHNLEEFIKAGVNAYALGCTNEGLRKELINMMETGVEIEAMDNFGGLTSLKSIISSQEVDECILWLSIIFVTILCTPQPTVIRWSASPPVTQGVLYYWKGFCAIIANAYYLKGMAWLPVKTLQLEQMAVTGYAEEPSVVASRMRLVFSTLEVVSPQWPRA